MSSDLNHDGSQSDPSLTNTSANALQSVYYALYILLLVFTFLLLPFTYFYYEEEDSEDSNVKSRTCNAFKYTAGFIVFFAVLLTLGLVLKKDQHNDATNWKDRLTNDFSNAEAVLSFCIGCLACVGLFAYVVYAAYGLARMPLKLMSRAKVVATLPIASGASSGGRSAGGDDLELSLRRNQENMQYLQSQYDLSGRPWSREDKKQMDDLRREQRRLQSLRSTKMRTGGSTASSRSGYVAVNGPQELTCWDRCWNILIPVRMVIAIPLLLVSLLLVVSLTLTVIDKLMHSTCGASCGYSLLSTHIVNPIDAGLKGLAKAFPIDCLLFAALVIYIFFATISGVVGLGVRICVFKLYSIQKTRTMPNAYLMAAWLFQLMVLALNMETLTIAPTYAAFGNQFYLNTTSGERVSCDEDLIGVVPHTCIQTQIGKFINTMSVETPFFSVILFYGNLAFLAFFLLFLVHGVFCADNSAKEEVDEFRRLDDLSD